jgi:uncharacterized protein YdaU (DUF1376 family)
VSRRPFYKRYPRDFLMDTADLCLEEKGAYSCLLDLMYARGGPIPDEPQWLAGQLGCSTRRWNQLRASLLKANKITPRGEYLSNERVERELEVRQDYTVQQVEWGRKGGKKRANALRRQTEPELPINQPAPKQINHLAQGYPKPRPILDEAEDQGADLPEERGPYPEIIGDAANDYMDLGEGYPSPVMPYAGNSLALPPEPDQLSRKSEIIERGRNDYNDLAQGYPSQPENAESATTRIKQNEINPTKSQDKSKINRRAPNENNHIGLARARASEGRDSEKDTESVNGTPNPESRGYVGGCGGKAQRAKPKPSRNRARSARQLPKTWQPPDAMPESVRAIVAQWPPGMMDRETERFRSWALANGATKKNWDHTLWNWLRKADDDWRNSERRYAGKPSGWSF